MTIEMCLESSCNKSGATRSHDVGESSEVEVWQGLVICADVGALHLPPGDAVLLPGEARCYCEAKQK